MAGVLINAVNSVMVKGYKVVSKPQSAECNNESPNVFYCIKPWSFRKSRLNQGGCFSSGVLIFAPFSVPFHLHSQGSFILQVPSSGNESWNYLFDCFKMEGCKDNSRIADGSLQAQYGREIPYTDSAKWKKKRQPKCIAVAKLQR